MKIVIFGMRKRSCKICAKFHWVLKLWSLLIRLKFSQLMLWKIDYEIKTPIDDDGNNLCNLMC